MLLDLKKEWKERSIRKAFLNTDSTKTVLNFGEYTKSASRNEMPNKYNISQIPKIEIERVYHSNLIRKAKSISGDIPTSSIAPIAPTKPSQRPFYYTSNNEILSLEEFLQVHKELSTYRKKQDKIKFNNTLIEKRQKIEEVYTERPLSSLTTRRASECNLNILSSRRLLSSQTSRKISMSQIPGLNATKLPFEEIQREKTDSSLAAPIPTEKAEKVLTGKSLQGINAKSDLNVEISCSAEKPFSIKESTRVMPNSARGFTTNQKFTEKEIMKHLIRGTVSPKPVKFGGRSVEKERAYISMFKDPKVMDFAVEASIRKANKICDNIEANDLTNEQSQVSKSQSISGVKKIDKNFESQITPFDGTEEGLGKMVAKKIKRNIRHISLVLSTTPRYTGEIIYEPPGPITERNKVPKKAILRSEIQQKYRFKQQLEQNWKLARKMKDVTKAVKKDTPASAIKNQSYVDFYN